MGGSRERVVVPPAAAPALDPVLNEGVGARLRRIYVDGLDLVPVRALASSALEGKLEGALVRSIALCRSEKPGKVLEHRSRRRRIGRVRSRYREPRCEPGARISWQRASAGWETFVA